MKTSAVPNSRNSRLVLPVLGVEAAEVKRRAERERDVGEKRDRSDQRLDEHGLRRLVPREPDALRRRAGQGLVMHELQALAIDAAAASPR